MNLSDIIVPTLESALNAYLGMDPDTERTLQQISGKVIAFRLTDLDLEFYFMPSQEHVSVMAHCDERPEVMISGSVLTLMRMGLSGDAGKAASVKDVEIRGDLELGRAFYELLSKVEIEWEELLARRVGDIPAHQIGSIVRGVKGWIDRAGDSLRMDLSEYLQEESRIMPAKPEIEAFMDGVDTLRSDVDRLQARVERLAVYLREEQQSTVSDEDPHDT